MLAVRRTLSSLPGSRSPRPSPWAALSFRVGSGQPGQLLHDEPRGRTRRWRRRSAADRLGARSASVRPAYGGVPDGGCSMVGMPTAAVRWSASEQPESTLLRHSASHSERLFLPQKRPCRRDRGTAQLDGELPFPISRPVRRIADPQASVARIAAKRRVAVISPASLAATRLPLRHINLSGCSTATPDRKPI